MLKDGEIKEFGTYNQLRGTNGDFDEFIGEHVNTSSENKEKKGKTYSYFCYYYKLSYILKIFRKS